MPTTGVFGEAPALDDYVMRFPDFDGTTLVEAGFGICGDRTARHRSPVERATGRIMLQPALVITSCSRKSGVAEWGLSTARGSDG